MASDGPPISHQKRKRKTQRANVKISTWKVKNRKYSYYRREKYDKRAREMVKERKRMMLSYVCSEAEWSV